MSQITVPVPDDRISEFYLFFSRWLEGAVQVTEQAESTTSDPASSKPAPAHIPWGDSEQDLADAAALWAKYSPAARSMFNLLIDNPGKKYTGWEIAGHIGVAHGARGVAGVLAWPGRHGIAIGRGLPSEWQQDGDRDGGSYWIPAGRAQLFKIAREQVEGAA